MRWKTTLVLILAVLGLGAYISRIELRRPTAEQRVELTKRILDLSPDAVTRLAIDVPQAKVALVRAGERWMLVPQHVRADGALIEGVLAQLAPLEAERVLTPDAAHPLSPGAYGLDPAIGRLTLTADGISTTLLFGDTTPIGNNRYVQLAGRPELFIVSGASFDALNQPASAFRNPRLLELSGWQLDTLSASSDRGTVSLTRGDRTWMLTQPLADRADPAELSALLQRLAKLRIQRFVTDAPQERPAAWGFDRPTAEFRLRQRETASDLVLTFGAPLPDDAALLYATRSDEPSVYAVSAPELTALLMDPNGLRAKTCFDFVPGQIREAEVAWQGKTWGAARNETGWKERETGAVLDATAVERWLGAAAELRLGGFLEEQPSDLARYGLQPPVGSLTVWVNGQDAPQRLLLGSPIDSSKNRYGRIEGRSAVVRLPEEADALLAVHPQQLAAPAVSATAPKSAGGPATPAAARSGE